MNKTIVNENDVYGKWTIIKDLGIIRNQHKVLCKCQCGNQKEILLSHLIKGTSTSCGKCNMIQVHIGDKFGKWTVISEPFTKNRKKYYQCQCECGTIKSLYHYKLVNGKTTSCGCGRIVLRDKTDRRLYDVLHHMKDRCYNPLNKKYKDYGARGITICDEWLNSHNGLDAFIKWSYDNGYDKNAQYGECTIDRIDVNGNYEPLNCRWANAITQGNNKRNNVLLTYNGETHTITEWANIIGIKRDTIDARYRRGLSIDKILSPHLLK